MAEKQGPHQSKTVRKNEKKERPIDFGTKLESSSCFHTHGEIHFGGTEEPIKFTRIATRPTRLQWQQLLAERWNLKPPTLIISIIGSRVEVSKRFKRTFKNGLWKAAESAGCWIISDGLDRGLARVAGEAVSDYKEAYGKDRMTMVGVATYEKLAFQDLFNSAMKQSRSRDNPIVIKYPPRMSDEESNDEGLSAQSSLDLPYWPKQSIETDKAPTEKDMQGKNLNLTEGKQLTQSQRLRKRHFRLNQNHQFLLLVDQLAKSSLEEKRNRCLEMRILFERTIVTWAKPPTSSTTTSHSSKRTEFSGGLQHGTDSQQKQNKGIKSPAQPLRENLARKSRTSIALPTLGDGMFDTITPRGSRVYSNQLQPQFFDKGVLGVPSSDRSSTPISNVTNGHNIQPGNVNDGNSKESADNASTTSDVIARVPICGIVAGGGSSTIEHIYMSVTLNRCPMVIVRGSGGMAEVIAEVIDFMNFKNSIEENVISDEEVNLKIASIIHETRSITHLEKTGPTRAKKQYKKPTKGVVGNELKSNNEKEEADRQKGPVIDYKAYAHQVALIREMVEEHSHLLSVFDSDDTDLDGYMISALLSSAGMDTPKNELNLDQLEIAIRLNRADIARTKIFLEGKRWKDYKTGLLQQLWKRARIYKMDWVMLRDIGRIIKNLVGDFYHPLYLTKRFRSTVVTHGLNDSSDEEDLVEDVPKGPKKGGRNATTTEISPDVTSASTLPEEEEADITSSFRNKLRAHSCDAGISKSSASEWSTNNGPRPSVKPKQDATKNVKPKKQIYKPVKSEHGVANDDSQPLLKHPGEVEEDNDDELTLRGSSDHSSDESSDMTVVEETRSRPRTREDSACQQPLKPKTTPTPAFCNQPPNGRCYIVRPITAFQLGYQPYVGTSLPVPKNGLLAFGSTTYSQSNSSRLHSVGKYRVIDYTHKFDDQRTTAPKAQMESIRNLKIQNTLKANGTDKKAASVIVSDQNGKLAPTVTNKPNPAILVVKVYTPTHGRIGRPEGPRRQRGHAVFAADTQQSSKRQARSLGRVQTETHVNILGNRTKFGDGARRVTHSILHPLTDPEITQLKLKETERRARERRKEKERKFRHRVAQGKFTIMERLTGKAKEQNFSHTVTVTFERPAREIMIMCMLLGKLTMTQVFWSHEKEPIAAALIGSILFGELASKSDDVTCKEEYEEAARTFEEKAEEVLDECYQEDRLRTQLLLCRKLDFYGSSSVIRLAARGRCIRFMAHPCCQDLLSGVWMGGLSPKYTWIQFLTGIIIGLSCPLLLPQVMKYTTAIGEDTNGVDQSTGNDGNVSADVARKSIREQASHLRYSLSVNRKQKPPSKLKKHFTRIQEFYQAPITRFIYNTIFYQLFLAVFSQTLLKNLTLSFSYNELFLVLMVVSFLCEELKQAFGSDSSFSEYISDGWNQLDCLAIGLFSIGFALRIQAYGHVQQIGETALLTTQLGVEKNLTDPTVIPFYHVANFTQFVHETYWAENQNRNSTAIVYNVNTNDSKSQCDKNFADRMDSFDCTGSILITNSTSDEYSTWSVDSPYYILTDELFTIARIFYAMSLFAFFVRLMYIFSFSMVLGPKLVMINRMVVHDLLPFLSILLVCQLGYGIAFQSISFANGFFTDYEQDKMTINSTLTRKSGLKSLYDVVTRSYFQMLGEFRVDELEGESSACRDKNLCPQTSARRLTVVMLSAFILLTQVLMFNLLVATFTSTYNEIEGSSQYFWCYQRYEMIQEFVDRPSVAPPFMLLWYTVELTNFLMNLLSRAIFGRGYDDKEDDDPFCRSLQCNPALENKLTKWEYMIGSRRTRADGEGAGARKWTGGGTRGEGHAIILRTVGGGTSGAVAATAKGLGRDTTVGRGGGVDAGSLLQGIGPIFGPETMFIEDRFVELGNQLGRFATMEEKLSKIVQTTKGLVKVLKQVTQQQKQMINSLHPKDGRRLVGRGQKRDSSRKNLIIEAVSNAVAGLSSHCSHIEEKIEEKIRIEKQCVKAVLTRSNADDLEPDIVLQASRSGPPSRGPRAVPPTGRILERVLLSHRLWRIVPFNFEIYPGIRMNVPIDMLNWKVPYKEYRAFKITEDRLAIPYPGMDDGPEVIPQQLPYNEYDGQQGVSRMTCRGRVRVYRKTPGTKSAMDEATNLIGLPLNPTGRSGLRDKGLLPHWGPNHAITIALTRPHPDGLMQAGLPVIQVAVLFRNQNFCLPWVSNEQLVMCCSVG
ncbi:hypothetical protein EG68_02737 [Paragonimus skrjabini miyazakii]|uniref:Uncharacterized protein n=1 Tax=Paragonimus skrjabini miyazakii TaxID=59628 RepID=A0A8S9YZI0_9TREM|nr:hypothetical protein EG68_02737 [Paragonimus skrjabini miyazakii]